MNLPNLNFPSTYDFKITKSPEDTYFIFDKIRKKNLVLTPEEWVRQHFIHYMMEVGFSPSQILLEKGFFLNQTKKRLDILVVRKNNPQILIELKSPHLNLQKEYFEQAARYNIVFEAPFVLLSNGLQHIVFEKDDHNTYFPIEDWQALFRGVLSN